MYHLQIKNLFNKSIRFETKNFLLQSILQLLIYIYKLSYLTSIKRKKVLI